MSEQVESNAVHRAVKNRLAKAQAKKNQTIQRVQIVEPKTSFWRFWSTPVFLWRLVEVCGFAIAIWALLEAVQSNDLAREQTQLARTEAEQGRIVAAWNILTTKAPGNSGKKEALETLHRAGQTLDGIDLSCRTMGGKTVAGDSRECRPPTALQNVQIPGANLNSANLDGVELDGANLRGAKLNWVKLNGAILENVDIEGAELNSAEMQQAYLGSTNLSDANLRFAVLQGASMITTSLQNANFWDSNLEDARIESSNLSGVNFFKAKFKNAILVHNDLQYADLRAADMQNSQLQNSDFLGANFDWTNLSGARFCGLGIEAIPANVCAKNLEQSQIEAAWAWADMPPVFRYNGEVLDLKPPPLCPVALRKDYEASKRFGTPKGC